MSEVYKKFFLLRCSNIRKGFFLLIIEEVIFQNFCSVQSMHGKVFSEIRPTKFSIRVLYRNKEKEKNKRNPVCRSRYVNKNSDALLFFVCLRGNKGLKKKFYST